METTIDGLFIDEPLDTDADATALLLRADYTLLNGRRSAVVLGKAVMLIGNSALGIDLREMEMRFRRLESPTHLLARPDSLMPVGMASRMIRSRVPAPYHLWIAVNGPDEAAELLRSFGTVDAAQNLERLAVTGLLEVPAGC